ncbi:MAG: sulfatase-like hydrolase/transferase, partial [Sulfurimonas sp.]|nr:sulfatase-like hydrolase/transferase [Sulfurimonas sp.]
SHFHYYFPRVEKFEKFKPYYKGNINFLDPKLRSKRKLIFNRYKNSVRYVDYLVDQVVRDIKQKGKWEETIFIFFGDHGEEFYEEHHFTHAAELNIYQTSAALFIHAPSDTKKESIYKTTSHIDIVPSILSILEKYSSLKYEKPSWLRGHDIHSDSYKARAVFSTNSDMKITKNSGAKFSINYEKNVFEPTTIETDSLRQNLIKNNIKDLLDFEKKE